MSGKPTCFVVMGFGKKTAYSKDKPPRVLDLDATFEVIIEPAVVKAGYECIRADKILHSGMIDVPMYKMLHQADLVIADISTANVNAVYELGVRHALRSRSTIIMKEDKGDFSFDLNHISTFSYEHLGTDIGARVAKKKVEELCALIQATELAEESDSPVYICLPDLVQEPVKATGSLASGPQATAPVDPLAKHLELGRQAMKVSDFSAGVQAFAAALSVLRKGDSEPEKHGDFSFVTQQLALATYKAEQPSKKQALDEGLRILSALSPATSGDIETLGIAGAIHKRLYAELAKSVGADDPETRMHLDFAIEYYGRGFHSARDYYNGENYANYLDVRAASQTKSDEAVCDRVTAQRVRKAVVRELRLIVDIELLEASPDTPQSGRFKKGFFQKPDWDWMLATMANCLFATGQDSEARRYERVILKAAEQARHASTDAQNGEDNPALDWDFGKVELEPWREVAGKAGWKLDTYLQSRELACQTASASAH